MRWSSCYSSLTSGIPQLVLITKSLAVTCILYSLSAHPDDRNAHKGDIDDEQRVSLLV